MHVLASDIYIKKKVFAHDFGFRAASSNKRCMIYTFIVFPV